MQLEDEADRAEVLPGRLRGLARPPSTWGLTRSALLERPLLGPVVVDHEDVDPLAHQVGHLVVGVGAAVERDEEPGLARLERAVDGAAGEPVAVLRAARDDEARVEAEAPQDGDEERGAADPVDVVVAEDDHPLPAHDRRLEPRHGRDEVADQERVLEPGQVRPQELLAAAGSRCPPRMRSSASTGPTPARLLSSSTSPAGTGVWIQSMARTHITATPCSSPSTRTSAPRRSGPRHACGRPCATSRRPGRRRRSPRRCW